eukprot:INCI10349.1.p1 GENE.INCI10349.1~~INCI10349.1.p1  ORF type:complete len:753 (+),score=112.92 INCI10349.1:37-2259(+)
MTSTLSPRRLPRDSAPAAAGTGTGTAAVGTAAANNNVFLYGPPMTLNKSGRRGHRRSKSDGYFLNASPPVAAVVGSSASETDDGFASDTARLIWSDLGRFFSSFDSNGSVDDSDVSLGLGKSREKKKKTKKKKTKTKTKKRQNATTTTTTPTANLGVAGASNKSSPPKHGLTLFKKVTWPLFGKKSARSSLKGHSKQRKATESAASKGSAMLKAMDGGGGSGGGVDAGDAKTAARAKLAIASLDCRPATGTATRHGQQHRHHAAHKPSRSVTAAPTLLQAFLHDTVPEDPFFSAHRASDASPVAAAAAAAVAAAARAGSPLHEAGKALLAVTSPTNRGRFATSRASTSNLRGRPRPRHKSPWDSTDFSGEERPLEETNMRGQFGTAMESRSQPTSAPSVSSASPASNSSSIDEFTVARIGGHGPSPSGSTRQSSPASTSFDLRPGFSSSGTLSVSMHSDGSPSNTSAGANVVVGSGSSLCASQPGSLATSMESPCATARFTAASPRATASWDAVYPRPDVRHRFVCLSSKQKLDAGEITLSEHARVVRESGHALGIADPFAAEYFKSTLSERPSFVRMEQLRSGRPSGGGALGPEGGSSAWTARRLLRRRGQRNLLQAAEEERRRLQLASSRSFNQQLMSTQGGGGGGNYGSFGLSRQANSWRPNSRSLPVHRFAERGASETSASDSDSDSSDFTSSDVPSFASTLRSGDEQEQEELPHDAQEGHDADWDEDDNVEYFDV